MQDIKPGDIIKYDNGKLDYIFKLDANEGPGINACNKSWIERGLRNYGDELYPISTLDLSDAGVVGHYGDGSYGNGIKWYEDHKNDVD